MRPGIFVSRTREKLGCTCDQIGRTLEPCTVYLCMHNKYTVNTTLILDAINHDYYVYCRTKPAYMAYNNYMQAWVCKTKCVCVYIYIRGGHRLIFLI